MTTTVSQIALARPREFWLVVILSSIAAVGTYCITAAAYLNHDCFVMAEAAQDVLAGKTLYGTACWDNKPPLALLAYALPQMVFPHSYTAVQGFLGLWLILQAAIFAWFLRDECWVATGLGCLSLVLLPLIDKEFLWAASEHWHNLFALLVILPSVRLWRSQQGSAGLAALAGAAVVLAMHCRQTGILWGVVPVAAVATSQMNVRQRLILTAAGLAGAVVAWLGIVTLCASIGNLNGYFDTTFLAPGRYSQRRIAAFVETAYFFFATYRNSAIGLLAVVALTGSWQRRDALLLVAATVVTGVLIVAPTKPFQHYMIQAFPLMALCIQSCITRLNALTPVAARVATAGLGGFLIMNAAFAAATLPVGRGAHMMNDLAAVAGAIRSAEMDGDTMFAVGNESAYLYFATDVASVHPVFWDLFFGSLSSVLPYHLETVIAQYHQSPPSLLILRDDVYATSQTTLEIPVDAQPCKAAIALSRDLIQHEQYREVERTHGWIVLRHLPLQAASAEEADPSNSRLTVLGGAAQ